MIEVYENKSLSVIKNDVSNEFNKINNPFINDNKEIYQAGLNTIEKYKDEISEVSSFKRTVNGKTIELRNRNNIQAAKVYFDTAYDEISKLHDNIKWWNRLNNNQDIINNIAERINTAEENALNKILEGCMLFNESNGTLTFNNAVNPLKITDVIDDSYDNYTIDYSNCTNKNIKSKIFRMCGGYICKLKYNPQTKSYFLADSRGDKLYNALVWNGVKIKKNNDQDTNIQTDNPTNIRLNDHPRNNSGYTGNLGTEGNIDNNQDNKEYLIGPKIEAQNKDEIGGLGNSIMNGFQGYNSKSKFPYMDGVVGTTTVTHPRRFHSEDGKSAEDDELAEKDILDYKNNHPGIQSFMFYFGVNTIDYNKTYNDIEKWGILLKKHGIQPVLCTCVGADTRMGRERNLATLNEMLLSLGKEKNRPVIDFAGAYSNGRISLRRDGVHPSNYNIMTNIINNNLG